MNTNTYKHKYENIQIEMTFRLLSLNFDAENTNAFSNAITNTSTISNNES